MKIYSPNREERAFLYQEAQELASLMKDLGSLSVMVEEMQNKRRNDISYRVTFVLAPESVGMKVQATDGNFFEAAIAARNEAQRQLNAIVNSLPQEMAPGGAAAQGKPPTELLN